VNAAHHVPDPLTADCCIALCGFLNMAVNGFFIIALRGFINMAINGFYIIALLGFRYAIMILLSSQVTSKYQCSWNLYCSQVFVTLLLILP